MVRPPGSGHGPRRVGARPRPSGSWPRARCRPFPRCAAAPPASGSTTVRRSARDFAWEHVASGLSPEAGRRWAAVEFDPATYEAWQEGARFAPWWAGLDRRAVVFDAPYTRTCAARLRLGGWWGGALTIRESSWPGDRSGLLAEFRRRFGRYPAPEWTYGLPWPSAARARAMGEGLTRALAVRTAGGPMARGRAAPGLGLLPRGRRRNPRRDRRTVARRRREPPSARPSIGGGGGPGGRRSASGVGPHGRGTRFRRRRRGGRRVHHGGDGAQQFRRRVDGPSARAPVPARLLARFPLLTVPPEWAPAPDSLPPLREGESWTQASQARAAGSSGPIGFALGRRNSPAGLAAAAAGQGRPQTCDPRGGRLAPGQCTDRAAGPPLAAGPALPASPASHAGVCRAVLLRRAHPPQSEGTRAGRHRRAFAIRGNLPPARGDAARMPRPAHRRAGGGVVRARFDARPARLRRVPKRTFSSSGAASSPRSSIRGSAASGRFHSAGPAGTRDRAGWPTSRRRALRRGSAALRCRPSTLSRRS